MAGKPAKTTYITVGGVVYKRSPDDGTPCDLEPYMVIRDFDRREPFFFAREESYNQLWIRLDLYNKQVS
jgi:hypothetical protein